MSVLNESNKIGYTASGNPTYAVPFLFTNNSHIKLYVDDVLKVYNTDYSVTGANNEDGGELTFLTTPPSTGSVVIIREIPLTQPDSFNDAGPNSAKLFERKLDTLTLMSQQINEKAERSIKMPISSNISPQMTGEVVPGAMIVMNDEGTALRFGPSYTVLEGIANAAAVSETNAQTSAIGAQASAEAAALSELNAATAETNATSKALEAQGSATLAQQAADSVLFNDVIFITAGMSPVNVDDFYRGAMLACDCSLGPVVINLPLISSLDLSYPWTVSIKKTDSSGNSVTINRAGSNLIDEGTTKVLGSASSGVTLIPDADPNPDVWTSAEFGAAAGNIVNDVFSGNGSQTAFTLSVAPGSKNNTQVFIEGVYQNKSGYSLSGTTLTFSEAPPTGTSNIEVNTGTTLPIGTPADTSVTIAKLAQDVLNFLIPVGTKIESIRQDTPVGFVSGMNKSLGKTTGTYVGSAYYDLYQYMWAMPGLSVTAGDPFRISTAKGASALADWDAGKTITIDFETNEIFTRAKGASRNLGSYEADALQGHRHNTTSSGGGLYNSFGGQSLNNNAGGTPPTFVSTGPVSDGTSGTPRTANETRSKNVALNVFFKY